MPQYFKDANEGDVIYYPMAGVVLKLVKVAPAAAIAYDDAGASMRGDATAMLGIDPDTLLVGCEVAEKAEQQGKLQTRLPL